MLVSGCRVSWFRPIWHLHCVASARRWPSFGVSTVPWWRLLTPTTLTLWPCSNSEERMSTRYVYWGPIYTLQHADHSSAETLITLVLWFLFWFPGFIYALWLPIHIPHNYVKVWNCCYKVSLSCNTKRRCKRRMHKAGWYKLPGPHMYWKQYMRPCGLQIG